MKTEKLMFALLGTLTISAIDIDPPIINTRPVYSSETILSKFTGDENLVWPISYTISKNNNHKLIVSLYNAVNDSFLYSKTYSAAINVSNNILNVDLPIKNRLKADGLKIVFEYALKTSVYQTEQTIIYPYSKQYINIAAHRNDPYAFHGNYLAIDEGKLYSDEEFNFSNLNEYLSVSQNNKIDLSNISFKYDGYGDYFCDDVTLYINDYNNVFPNLKKVDGLIPLKMKYSQIDDEVSLGLDELLYVNLDNLDMSSTMLANYTQTDVFYVPINKEELLSGDDIYILMTGSGHSESNFTLPFDFYYSKKYVGECYESDYCIHGGVKE